MKEMEMNTQVLVCRPYRYIKHFNGETVIVGSDEFDKAFYLPPLMYFAKEERRIRLFEEIVDMDLSLVEEQASTDKIKSASLSDDTKKKILDFCNKYGFTSEGGMHPYHSHLPARERFYEVEESKKSVALECIHGGHSILLDTVVQDLALLKRLIQCHLSAKDNQESTDYSSLNELLNGVRMEVWYSQEDKRPFPAFTFESLKNAMAILIFEAITKKRGIRICRNCYKIFSPRNDEARSCSNTCTNRFHQKKSYHKHKGKKSRKKTRKSKKARSK